MLYSYGKRDLFLWQKIPIHMAKETYLEDRERVLQSMLYSYGKRDLFLWQKIPVHMAKETYLEGRERVLQSSTLAVGLQFCDASMNLHLPCGWVRDSLSSR